MKTDPRIRVGAIVAMASAALLFLAVSAPLAAQASGGIDGLAWLQGCWMTSGNQSVEEQWMAPRGGSMIGMSRTVQDGRMTGYELVIIREEGDELLYQAHPSGQASATFRSITVTADSVVFENPEHDFPQRIGYRRDGDSLTAWIEGTRSGQIRRGEFRYARAACPDVTGRRSR